MKVLITGGNGFLGKHVIKEMYNKNIDTLTPTSKQLDILNFQQLNDYLFKSKPDCILHMAAKCGGILYNQKSPADLLRDNTIMGINIYEAARQNNITNIYSLGSVCSYPKYCPVPFREDDIWNGAAEETNFPYGQAKRTLLMLHQSYRAQYGLTGAFLIPVNLFGPNDHFDLENSHVIPALINKFTNAVEKDLPIVECWGTGDATREFLYAGDAAKAIVKAVSEQLDTSLPINLGTGQDISIKDLANLIKELTNFKGKVIFNGAVSDGQPKRMLDVSRAQEILNWKAETSLKNGLEKTIEWFNLNK